MQFALANAVQDDLPDADAVLIREVLFHLSFDDIRSVLRNILSKPRRLLLVTNDNFSKFNSDIRSGDWRPLNLEAAPFHFPPASMRIDEASILPKRHLGVWKVEDLPRI